MGIFIFMKIFIFRGSITNPSFVQMFSWVSFGSVKIVIGFHLLYIMPVLVFIVEINFSTIMQGIVLEARILVKKISSQRLQGAHTCQ